MGRGAPGRGASRRVDGVLRLCIWVLLGVGGAAAAADDADFDVAVSSVGKPVRLRPAEAGFYLAGSKTDFGEVTVVQADGLPLLNSTFDEMLQDIVKRRLQHVVVPIVDPQSADGADAGEEGFKAKAFLRVELFEPYMFTLRPHGEARDRRLEEKRSEVAAAAQARAEEARAEAAAKEKQREKQRKAAESQQKEADAKRRKAAEAAEKERQQKQKEAQEQERAKQERQRQQAEAQRRDADRKAKAAAEAHARKTGAAFSYDAVFPEEGPMGMSFDFQAKDPPPVVNEVTPGGAAFRKGVQVGDKLVAINGIDLSKKDAGAAVGVIVSQDWPRTLFFEVDERIVSTAKGGQGKPTLAGLVNLYDPLLVAGTYPAVFAPFAAHVGYADRDDGGPQVRACEQIPLVALSVREGCGRVSLPADVDAALRATGAKDIAVFVMRGSCSIFVKMDGITDAIAAAGFTVKAVIIGNTDPGFMDLDVKDGSKTAAADRPAVLVLEGGTAGPLAEYMYGDFAGGEARLLTVSLGPTDTLYDSTDPNDLSQWCADAEAAAEGVKQLASGVSEAPAKAVGLGALTHSKVLAQYDRATLRPDTEQNRGGRVFLQLEPEAMPEGQEYLVYDYARSLSGPGLSEAGGGDSRVFMGDSGLQFMKLAFPESLCNAKGLKVRIRGMWVAILRGGCGFYEKALAAQEAGARGLVLINNEAGVAPMMFPPNTKHPITIPSVMISVAPLFTLRDYVMENKNRMALVRIVEEPFTYEGQAG
mmetsp:Transcript_36722/g.115016  ORF Transcript_36722/g.115016 Transcript_36722/m.115016 type:complete len:759 (-) Transcript_36722:50-2326(-)|eukprot:CAMPEP_0118866962 /NCGR_PEP_ID=MMETSP1163-20130328/10725_1 /TAXON_ID=124430 /ORGANISM="Phaeomonas parva, Strain CCMP2877" /LENGTH=758 /DNA_ID=CAMNT_0006801335 /DNA_START=171 /DNA_END=2447 /DNA_ORIENTATION=-